MLRGVSYVGERNATGTVLARKYAKPLTDCPARQPRWVLWLIVALATVALVRGCFGI